MIRTLKHTYTGEEIDGLIKKRSGYKACMHYPYQPFPNPIIYTSQLLPEHIPTLALPYPKTSPTHPLSLTHPLDFLLTHPLDLVPTHSSVFGDHNRRGIRQGKPGLHAQASRRATRIRQDGRPHESDSGVRRGDRYPPRTGASHGAQSVRGESTQQTGQRGERCQGRHATERTGARGCREGRPGHAERPVHSARDSADDPMEHREEAAGRQGRQGLR